MSTKGASTRKLLYTDFNVLVDNVCASYESVLDCVAIINETKIKKSDKKEYRHRGNHDNSLLLKFNISNEIENFGFDWWKSARKICDFVPRQFDKSILSSQKHESSTLLNKMVTKCIELIPVSLLPIYEPSFIDKVNKYALTDIRNSVMTEFNQKRLLFQMVPAIYNIFDICLITSSSVIGKVLKFSYSLLKSLKKTNRSGSIEYLNRYLLPIGTLLQYQTSDLKKNFSVVTCLCMLINNMWRKIQRIILSTEGSIDYELPSDGIELSKSTNTISGLAFFDPKMCLLSLKTVTIDLVESIHDKGLNHERILRNIYIMKNHDSKSTKLPNFSNMMNATEEDKVSEFSKACGLWERYKSVFPPSTSWVTVDRLIMDAEIHSDTTLYEGKALKNGLKRLENPITMFNFVSTFSDLSNTKKLPRSETLKHKEYISTVLPFPSKNKERDRLSATVSAIFAIYKELSMLNIGATLDATNVSGSLASKIKGSSNTNIREESDNSSFNNSSFEDVKSSLDEEIMCTFDEWLMTTEILFPSQENNVLDFADMKNKYDDFLLTVVDNDGRSKIEYSRSEVWDMYSEQSRRDYFIKKGIEMIHAYNDVDISDKDVENSLREYIDGLIFLRDTSNKKANTQQIQKEQKLMDYVYFSIYSDLYVDVQQKKEQNEVSGLKDYVLNVSDLQSIFEKRREIIKTTLTDGYDQKLFYDMVVDKNTFVSEHMKKIETSFINESYKEFIFVNYQIDKSELEASTKTFVENDEFLSYIKIATALFSYFGFSIIYNFIFAKKVERDQEAMLEKSRYAKWKRYNLPEKSVIARRTENISMQKVVEISRKTNPGCRTVLNQASNMIWYEAINGTIRLDNGDIHKPIDGTTVNDFIRGPYDGMPRLFGNKDPLVGAPVITLKKDDQIGGTVGEVPEHWLKPLSRSGIKRYNTETFMNFCDKLQSSRVPEYFEDRDGVYACYTITENSKTPSGYDAHVRFAYKKKEDTNSVVASYFENFFNNKKQKDDPVIKAALSGRDPDIYEEFMRTGKDSLGFSYVKTLEEADPNRKEVPAIQINKLSEINKEPINNGEEDDDDNFQLGFIGRLAKNIKYYAGFGNRTENRSEKEFGSTPERIQEYDKDELDIINRFGKMTEALMSNSQYGLVLREQGLEKAYGKDVYKSICKTYQIEQEDLISKLVLGIKYLIDVDPNLSKMDKKRALEIATEPTRIKGFIRELGAQSVNEKTDISQLNDIITKVIINPLRVAYHIEYKDPSVMKGLYVCIGWSSHIADFFQNMSKELLSFLGFYSGSYALYELVFSGSIIGLTFSALCVLLTSKSFGVGSLAHFMNNICLVASSGLSPGVALKSLVTFLPKFFVEWAGTFGVSFTISNYMAVWKFISPIIIYTSHKIVVGKYKAWLKSNRSVNKRNLIFNNDRITPNMVHNIVQDSVIEVDKSADIQNMLDRIVISGLGNSGTIKILIKNIVLASVLTSLAFYKDTIPFADGKTTDAEALSFLSSSYVLASSIVDRFI